MKRSVAGGAHRGPVAHTRQRKTIRFMQGLLVACALALFVFAGVSLARVLTYEDPGGPAFDRPKPPSAMQPVTLALLGAAALGTAALLGGRDGVKLPTPARLEELVGRAEDATIARAGESADDPGNAR